MPVWIVVSLFWAFESVSVTIVVLTGCDCSNVIVDSSISNEQTFISFSCFAGLVEVIMFVHSVFLDGGVLDHDIKGVCIISDGGGSVTVTNITCAHELQDDFAFVIFLTARVLVGPFDGQLTSLVEVHWWSPTVTSCCIVLGIKKSILIVCICRLFVETIVASSWIVHVHITKCNS